MEDVAVGKAHDGTGVGGGWFGRQCHRGEHDEVEADFSAFFGSSYGGHNSGGNAAASDYRVAARRRPPPIKTPSRVINQSLRLASIVNRSLS